jgi:hypothetical protein
MTQQNLTVRKNIQFDAIIPLLKKKLSEPNRNAPDEEMYIWDTPAYGHVYWPNEPSQLNMLLSHMGLNDQANTSDKKTIINQFWIEILAIEEILDETLGKSLGGYGRRGQAIDAWKYLASPLRVSGTTVFKLYPSDDPLSPPFCSKMSSHQYVRLSAHDSAITSNTIRKLQKRTCLYTWAIIVLTLAALGLMLVPKHTLMHPLKYYPNTSITIIILFIILLPKIIKGILREYITKS